MSKIKNDEDLQSIREAGKRLSEVLDMLCKAALPGITPKALDAEAQALIQDLGDVPAFLGYTPRGAKFPYPAALCVSVNDTAVHGIPTDTALKEGDIVTLDLGLSHNGMIVDSARTVLIGKGEAGAKKLISSTREALKAGIQVARSGKKTGDIGAAVEGVVKGYGFSVARELGGHGVGYKVHEDPFVPNFSMPGEGSTLASGMVIAIEPIVSEGSGEVFLGDDGYSYHTADGSRVAQWEHTVLVTDGEPEVLTA